MSLGLTNPKLFSLLWYLIAFRKQTSSVQFDRNYTYSLHAWWKLTIITVEKKALQDTKIVQYFIGTLNSFSIYFH